MIGDAVGDTLEPCWTGLYTPLVTTSSATSRHSSGTGLQRSPHYHDLQFLRLPNALTLAQSMSQTPPLRDRCHTSLFADVLYALLAFTSREGRHCTGKREALWSRALRNDLMFGDNYADFKFVIRGARLGVLARVRYLIAVIYIHIPGCLRSCGKHGLWN